jgi:signal transduction histidine kinase
VITKRVLALPTGATVRLRYQADGVDVDVVDDGQATGWEPATAGQGIVGMRERAAAYGGVIDAGPDDGGGWRVHAHLRREAEEPW